MTAKIKKLPHPYNRYGVLLNNGEMSIISNRLVVMKPVQHRFAHSYPVYRLTTDDKRVYLSETDIKQLIGE